MSDRISKNFIIQEFVPEDIYKRYGNSSIWFIDKKIVDIAQLLRTNFGKPVYINNWHLGGARQESGFRVPNTTTGATLSQHKSGRAIDIRIKDFESEEIREYIRNTFTIWNEIGLTTIEEKTPTWVHLDCRWTGMTLLKEVAYK